jgi:hypothetical protein
MMCSLLASEDIEAAQKFCMRWSALTTELSHSARAK